MECGVNERLANVRNWANELLANSVIGFKIARGLTEFVDVETSTLVLERMTTGKWQG